MSPPATKRSWPTLRAKSRQPEAKVSPWGSGLTTASYYAVTPQGTLFDQRINEVDLRVSRSFRFAAKRLQGMVDFYNIFNNRPAQGVTTTFDSTWLRPTTLLGGRLFKFG